MIIHQSLLLTKRLQKLQTFEPLNHTLPTITVVSIFGFNLWNIVLEISKKVILRQVLKLHLLVLNPNFNLNVFFEFSDVSQSIHKDGF